MPFSPIQVHRFLSRSYGYDIEWGFLMILRFLIVLAIVFLGCDESGSKKKDDDNSSQPSGDDDDDDDDDGANKNGGATGSLGVSAGVSEHLETVNTNLGIVQENLAPPSAEANITLGGEGGGSLHLVDLAEEANEIHQRVKGTIEGTLRAINWVRGNLDQVRPELESAEGETGEKVIGAITLSWKIETKEKYQIRNIGGEQGNFHLEIDGSNYKLIRQSPGLQDYDVGNNLLTVSFVDDDNFTVKDESSTDDCDANRPEEIYSFVEKKGGIWRGKMGYGNGNENNDCPIEPAGQEFTYFQFIGDDEFMTASGYSDVPLSFTDWSTIETYGFQDETPANANPTCIRHSQDPAPGTACASDNVDISTPNYGIDDKWILPADLVKVWAAFPSGFSE